MTGRPVSSSSTSKREPLGISIPENDALGSKVPLLVADGVILTEGRRCYFYTVIERQTNTLGGAGVGSQGKLIPHVDITRHLNRQIVELK